MNLVRTRNLSAFVMKYYLLLVVAAVCEGARIPRISESYFPGFQGVYHGQGVPGFQHGQPDNYAALQFPGDYRGSYGNLDVGNEYHSRQTPLGDHANVADHFAGVPYNVASNHGGYNPQPSFPQNYGRFNHARDYDYQI